MFRHWDIEPSAKFAIFFRIRGLYKNDWGQAIPLGEKVTALIQLAWPVGGRRRSEKHTYSGVFIKKGFQNEKRDVCVTSICCAGRLAFDSLCQLAWTRSPRKEFLVFIHAKILHN